jgi:hypothetical protein
MNFETGMENDTTDVCGSSDSESCPTDPALLIEFKHAIHALSCRISAWGLLPAFRELLTWWKTYGPRRSAVVNEAAVGARIA